MQAASPLRLALRQAAAARRAAVSGPAPACARASVASAQMLRAPRPAALRSFSQSARALSKETTEDPAEAEKLTDKANEATYAEGAQEGNAELEKLKTELKEKDAKIKELTDAILYGKADLQNAQRRAAEEKAQAGDYAITRLARDLTSSIDILQLALNSVPEKLRQATGASDATLEEARKATAELYSGVDLTRKSLLEMLKGHGVTVFDPTGEKFNPQEHEALYQAPVPGKEPGTVLECSKVGFRIKNRILRAAQVGVVQDS